MRKFNYKTQKVEDIFLEAEKQILINAAKKLGDDSTLLTKDKITSWQAIKLFELGKLNRENIKILSQYADIEVKEIEKILEEIGYKSIDEIEGDLKKGADKGILLVPPNIEDSESLKQVLYAHKKEAKKMVRQINNTMLSQSGIKYLNSINYVTSQVVAGIKTPSQALQQVAKDWGEKGLPALIDKAGRKWTTESYVSMVIRTSVSNISNDMQDERMKEYGNDLIEISSHAGARPKCEPYQGRIFSISGRSDNYESIGNTSYGEPDGLFGINCGHRKYPYIPGITKKTYQPYNKTENDKIYKESQKQRYHERQIRAAKKELSIIKAIGDKEGIDKAKVKVRQRQASMREFIKDTNRTRRYDREQVY